MRLLARPLAVAEDVRSEEESMAIELLFALLLNVLHTCHPDEAPPEPGRVSEKLAETEALRAILCVMEKEHALELILYVLQQVPSLLPTVTALPTVTLLPSPSYRNPLFATGDGQCGEHPSCPTEQHPCGLEADGREGDVACTNSHGRQQIGYGGWQHDGPRQCMRCSECRLHVDVSF